MVFMAFLYGKPLKKSEFEILVPSFPSCAPSEISTPSKILGIVKPSASKCFAKS